MDAKEGISQDGHYTVPTSEDAYLWGAEFNAGKAGGGQSPSIEFRGLARTSTGGPWLQWAWTLGSRRSPIRT
tara:strand:+ start:891 stop:1106 length:216 start_codon:yes stop_codon:yes gene_type:complete